MTATGDNDGGLAVWPTSKFVLSSRTFCSVRPEHIPSRYEHRVFSQQRVSAMLTFLWAVRDAVRDFENRVDDSRGLHRRSFHATIMEAEFRYAQAIGEPVAREDGADTRTLVDFLFDRLPGPEGSTFIDTVIAGADMGCGVGEWVEREDGTAALRVWVSSDDVRMS